MDQSKLSAELRNVYKTYLFKLAQAEKKLNIVLSEYALKLKEKKLKQLRQEIKDIKT